MSDAALGDLMALLPLEDSPAQEGQVATTSANGYLTARCPYVRQMDRPKWIDLTDFAKVCQLIPPWLCTVAMCRGDD